MLITTLYSHQLKPNKKTVFCYNYQHQSTENTICSLYSGSSWTLIQHRRDGSQNFNESWENYKYGFGRLDGKMTSYIRSLVN